MTRAFFPLLCLCLFLFGTITSHAQSKKVSDDRQYKVIINHEEQYAVWLKSEAAPKGWKATKVAGSLEKCQRHIKSVWTDMRPLSIQKEYSKSDVVYGVVIEAEFLGAYQIWPTSKSLPKSYKATKFKGSFAECMKHINRVWTDMRPLSLR